MSPAARGRVLRTHTIQAPRDCIAAVRSLESHMRAPTCRRLLAAAGARGNEDFMNTQLWLRRIGAAGAVLVLAGCVARNGASSSASSAASAAPAAPAAPTCTPAAPGQNLAGVWQSNTRPPGVSGQYTALVTLSADGTMSFTTQLKVGKRVRPGLRETGCWKLADGVLTLHTTRSNGELVDAADPIYQNRYRVVKADGARLTLRELREGGQVITARRMPAGYRLPD